MVSRSFSANDSIDNMAHVLGHFIFTLLSNAGPLAFGLHLGWLGPFLMEMMGKGSPPSPTYGEPLTPNQISWLGGLLSASMLAATPIYGLLLQHVSYKPLTIFTNILHCLAFSLYIVPDINVAYLARFAAGFASVGSIVITPLYVNECVKPSFRGFIGALSSLSITFGVAVAYVTGSYTSFLMTNIVCLVCVLLFFLGVFWIPDSPVWLVMRKQLPAAKASLMKLRCESYEEVDREIFVIQDELNTSSDDKSAGLFKILGDDAMRKAMFLAMGMMVTQQATGIAPMQLYYGLVLFDKENPTNESFVAATIAVVQLCAAGFGAFLLNYAGRKSILVVTTIVICASYILLWILIEIQAKSMILRLTCAIIYFASYNIGLGTVPFVMLPEILPQRARAVSVAVAGLLTGIVSFLYSKLFPTFIEIYHLKYAMLIFATMSFLGIIFMVSCLFETKGKSASDIYKILEGVKPKPLLINRPVLLTQQEHGSC